MRCSARPGLAQQSTRSSGDNRPPLRLSSSLLPTKDSPAREKPSSPHPPHTAPCSHLKSKCSHCGPLNPTSLKTNELHRLLLFRSVPPPPQKACFVGDVLQLCCSVSSALRELSFQSSQPACNLLIVFL